MIFLDPDVRYKENDIVSQGPKVASEDHVIPTTLGGSRHVSNIVICCRQCNSVKGKEYPSKEVLFRLDVLNKKRNIEAQKNPGILTSDTFLKGNIKTLDILLDKANSMTGPEGVKTRRKISKRMTMVISYRRALKVVENKTLRIELTRIALNDLINRYSKEPLDDDLQSYFEATVKTIIRQLG